MPLWAWLLSVGLLLGLLAGDLALHRRFELQGARAALAESAAWIGASAGFGLVLGVTKGGATAGQYFAAYLLEKSLSVDNVLAFAAILAAFQVPRAHQRRVLHWGVVGALALRGAFVAAGAAFVEHVSWAFYPLGVLVLAAGLRMARGAPEVDVEGGRLVRAVRRVAPVAPPSTDGAFLARSGRRLALTPLLLALVVVELSDVVFAADSIPAVFGVTTDVFVVFTSNAFAVLGLRALYFVLAGALDRFAALPKALAVLLGLVGVKMLLRPVVEIPTAATLGGIAAVLGASIAASLLRRAPGSRPPRPRPAGGQAP